MDETSKPATVAGKPARNATIMIVEDEPIVAKDMETSLLHIGYAVCAAVSSGEEALEAAARFHPDLILMDIMLKGKLDGVETARRISAGLATPIIFLTAYSDENTINRAKETNAYGYLLKPFEEREVRSTIEMALYKSAVERQLKQNREWLASILRSISDGVITTDVKGLIEFCNPVAESLTGWAMEEMAGRSAGEVVVFESSAQNGAGAKSMRAMLQEADVPWNGETTLIARDGARLEIEYSIVPLRQSDGAVSGNIVVLRNIAARREAYDREQALQKRLSRAQRMESVGLLANGIAEQLRRIVGPIVDYPELINNKIAAGNNIAPDLAVIQNSARKALDILDDLITLGQIKDFAVEPLDLNLIVEEIMGAASLDRIKRDYPMVQIRCDLNPRIIPVTGNRQHLATLFNNLIMSACSRISDAGTVTVSSENTRISESIQGFEIIERGDYVIIRFSDSGRAMSEDEINRFFEPFAGGSEGGAPSRQAGGLDTALAYAIIKGHKGAIDIKSAEAGGTEIAIYFPVYTGPITLAETSENVALQGVESILVVDDDPELRKTAMAFLRSTGYKVFGARNGAEAVEFVRKGTKGEGPTIDMAVIDMIMADDFDGLETYRAMLALKPCQKAIIVSGFTVTQRIRDAMRLGVGQCLLKPYDQHDLAKAVRLELDKPGRE